MQRVALTEDCVKKIGRTYAIDQNLWMGLSGTGVEFSFSGMSLIVTVVGGSVAEDTEAIGSYARFVIMVDDERRVDDLVMQKEKSYVIFDGTKENHAKVRIMKLSESPMSYMGIAPLEIGDMDWIQPTEEKEHKIEIIGDSITCGYGVDDEDPLHNFSTATEDVTKSYSFKTATYLNADYSMVSASGYGIISGYTADPQVRNVSEVLPPYYESLGYSRDRIKGGMVPELIPWDFTKYQPDLVILNLGTNDDSFCVEDTERQEEYCNRYVAFLKVIRKNNPKAQILGVLGLMGARLYPYVVEAAKRYTAETGDAKIACFELPEQIPEDGYAADYHPIEKAHETAARALVPFVKELMNW